MIVTGMDEAAVDPFLAESYQGVRFEAVSKLAFSRMKTLFDLEMRQLAAAFRSELRFVLPANPNQRVDAVVE